jgi:hypothetical protein
VSLHQEPLMYIHHFKELMLFWNKWISKNSGIYLKIYYKIKDKFFTIIYLLYIYYSDPKEFLDFDPKIGSIYIKSADFSWIKREKNL